MGGGGGGGGEQGKAGAGAPRDAGLDGSEGEGAGGHQLEGLVEHELGHRCRGVSPAGHGLSRRIPERGGGPRAGAASAGRGKGARGQAAAEAEHSPPAERRAAMTWAQRLKRVITPVFPLLLRSARSPRQGSGCAHRATRSGSRRRRAGLAAGDALATAISATEVFNADRRALETTRLPCDTAFGLPLRFTWLSSQSIRG